MADITVTFSCGTKEQYDRSAQMDVIQCAHCGTRRVRSVNAPQPVVRVRDCAAVSPLQEE